MPILPGSSKTNRRATGQEALFARVAWLKERKTVGSRDSTQPSGISRLATPGVLGVGGVAAMLTSCDGDGNPAANRAPGNTGMAELPDPLSPIPSKKSTVADKKYAPPVPGKPLPPAVTSKEPQNYGIVPRSAWAKAGPDLKRVDPMDGVKLITFHHSGAPKPLRDHGLCRDGTTP